MPQYSTISEYHANKRWSRCLAEVLYWFEVRVNIHGEESKSLPEFVAEMSIGFNVSDVNIYKMCVCNNEQNISPEQRLKTTLKLHWKNECVSWTNYNT